MRSHRSDDGPLAVLAALVAGALAWFCIGVADLAAHPRRMRTVRRGYAAAGRRPVRLLPGWKEEEMSAESQARAFRIMAVGYAVLRDLADEVGPVAVRSMSIGITEGDLAKSLGRAALAAVEATAEAEPRQ